jgi:hypothetical protein
MNRGYCNWTLFAVPVRLVHAGASNGVRHVLWMRGFFFVGPY